MKRLRAWTATTTLRLALAIAGGFAAMALFLFAFIYWQTALLEELRIDTLLTQEVQRMAAAPPRAAALLGAWLEQDLHDVRYAAIFTAEGRRLAGNLAAPLDALAPDGVVHRGVIRPVGRDHDSDKLEVVRAIARHLPDGSLLVLAYDIDALLEVRGVILRGLGLALLPALVLSLASGLLLARRAQRRVAAAHAALERIMRGHLHERLPVRGGWDEMDKLAAAVNAMLDRLQRLVADSRAVGDNIAHDLRTPLTRLRARLERSRDQTRTRSEFQAAADQAISAVDQALGVVAAVLRIGAIEHGHRHAAFAPVALAQVLRDAAELYEPLAEARDMRLLLRLEDAAPVWGDHALLLEAVGNIVDNAIKFGPPGSDIVLALAARRGGAVLRVSDQGPGIPSAERDLVLQRFYRVARSRTVPGSGLGLSLVAAIVALHGFHLRIGGAPGCVVEILCAAGMHDDAPARPGLPAGAGSGAPDRAAQSGAS